MKATVLAGQFAAALAVAQKAVAKKAHIPILAGVLVEATAEDGGRLTLTGTDTYTRAWHGVAARVDRPGAVILPPESLARFLAAVDPADAVTISVNEQHKAMLVSGANKSTVSGLDADDYVPMAPIGGGAEVTFAPTVFAGLVKAVAYAAAKDESRPVLVGVLLQSAGGTVTLAAADGFRMAMVQYAFPDAPDLSVIVPASPLAQAAGMADGPVRLSVDAGGNRLLIASDGGSWALTLIDGQFPDFTRIVPAASLVTLELDREPFKRALGLVEKIDKGENGFKVKLTPTADAVGLFAHSQDEEAEATLTCVVTGEPLVSVNFNLTYLRQAVDAVDADRVALETNGPASPAIVRAAGARNGHLHVVMPMHVVRPKP